LAGLAILLRHEPLALRGAPIVALLTQWRLTYLETVAPEAPDTGSGPSVRGHLAVSLQGSPTDQPIRRSFVFRRPAADDAGDALPKRFGLESIIRSARRADQATKVVESSAVAAPAPGDPRRSSGPGPGRMTDVQPGLPITTAEVATDLGGLFHLVHLAQRLNLYSDFTTPGRRGIALGIWDFVALVGRQLLGRANRPLDPVWRLLADLQGRRYFAPAGVGFRPRIWRTRPDWLEPFPSEGPWRYSVDAGRLVLRHPYRFVVVDGRTDLDRELRRYRVALAVRDRARPLDPEISSRGRWVAHMAGYLRSRLAIAMGVRPAVAVWFALCRPAQVLVTASRVDVISELADLPIEVRLAAVDRDPGFVPAAGRSLYFHFQ
jgi:hypothetical protein